MAKERSTRPYLIRAICEWCSDSGFTAYLSVKVDANARADGARQKWRNRAQRQPRRRAPADDRRRHDTVCRAVQPACRASARFRLRRCTEFSPRKTARACFSRRSRRPRRRPKLRPRRPPPAASPNCRSSSKRPGVRRALSVGNVRVRILLPTGNHARLYNYTLQMRSALENDRFAQIKETYKNTAMGAAICATAM